MIDLQAKNSVFRMSVKVTRKDTGKVETYDLIGTPITDTPKEQDNGRNTPSRSA